MTSRPECQICAHPMADNAYVCKPCNRLLDRNLGEVPSLAEEVETTRLRQSRTAKTSGIGIVLHVTEEDRPVPFTEQAPAALRELRAVLAGYATLVSSTRGVTAPTADVPSLSRFLLRHSEWLRHREDAADIQREIEWAIHALRRTIDLPAERVFAGPCGAVDYACPHDHDHLDPETVCDPQPIIGSPPCTGSVFGRGPKARIAICDTCGCEHVMADRREWLLKAVEDQLDYAARLSQALSNLGIPVHAATIRKWAERGRLVAHGHDDHDRPLYRVGDVMDLATADAVKQSRKAAS